jgi:hypothetical protein
VDSAFLRQSASPPVFAVAAVEADKTFAATYKSSRVFLRHLYQLRPYSVHLLNLHLGYVSSRQLLSNIEVLSRTE